MLPCVYVALVAVYLDVSDKWGSGKKALMAQVGAFLVAGGTPGKRVALPNSRFAMENPRMYPPYDNEGRPIRRPMQATEMKLEVEEVMRDKKNHCGMIRVFETKIYHQRHRRRLILHLARE